MLPASPVRYQAPSSMNRSAVCSGAPAYPGNHSSGLSVTPIATRPTCPGGSTVAEVSSRTAADQPGSGRPMEPGRTGSPPGCGRPLAPPPARAGTAFDNHHALLGRAVVVPHRPPQPFLGPADDLRGERFTGRRGAAQPD